MPQHTIDDRHAPLLYSGSVSSPSTEKIFPAVELAHLSLLFGSFVALRDLSLELPAGASVVLLGENGAGKSTLLRVIAGLVAPSFGSVAVLGDTPRNRHGRIALMGHASQLYDELTALENLTFFASLHTPAPAASLRGP